MRNAGTPLEIASIPVTAEQPAANALSSSRIPSVSVAGNVSLVPIIATGWDRSAPTTIVAKMLIRNRKVGATSSRADSWIPNMFTTVSIRSPAMLTNSRWCERPGNTLPRLAAPADRLTATVST